MAADWRRSYVSSSPRNAENHKSSSPQQLRHPTGAFRGRDEATGALKEIEKGHMGLKIWREGERGLVLALTWVNDPSLNPIRPSPFSPSPAFSLSFSLPLLFLTLNNRRAGRKRRGRVMAALSLTGFLLRLLLFSIALRQAIADDRRGIFNLSPSLCLYICLSLSLPLPVDISMRHTGQVGSKRSNWALNGLILPQCQRDGCSINLYFDLLPPQLLRPGPSPT